MDVKKVVIVGGGFGGINLAQKLSRNKLFQIVLVDKNNYNFFPPLLYQVATGFLGLRISAIRSASFFRTKVISGLVSEPLRGFFPMKEGWRPKVAISIMTTSYSQPAPRAIISGWKTCGRMRYR